MNIEYNNKKKVSKLKTMIFKCNQEDVKTLHFKCYKENKPLTMKDAFELLGNVNNNLVECKSFISILTKTIQSVSFKSFFFEMPPINSSLMSRQFEFVIIDAPEFENKSAEPSDFKEHMQKGKKVVSFENLRKDAILVVPCGTKASGFMDLNSFLTNATKSQIISFWKEVAKNLLFKVENNPDKKIWCSTSGLGVSWLHFRIDNKPKYYKYQDFKN